MSKAQATATQIPVSDLIPMLTAISERNYTRFQELEQEFASLHGVETWQEVFNFRVLPALDKPASQWLLIQWCSKGIVSVKDITNA